MPLCLGANHNRPICNTLSIALKANSAAVDPELWFAPWLDTTIMEKFCMLTSIWKKARSFRFIIFDNFYRLRTLMQLTWYSKWLTCIGKKSRYVIVFRGDICLNIYMDISRSVFDHYLGLRILPNILNEIVWLISSSNFCKNLV